MTTFNVSTDGSCSTHGIKAGGWAAIILKDGEMAKILTGSAAPTTISRMELGAIIGALEWIKSTHGFENCQLHFHSDSQFVVRCATGEYSRRANLDQWDQFNHASRGANFTIVHVGRNSDPKMTKCDELAGVARIALERKQTSV